MHSLKGDIARLASQLDSDGLHRSRNPRLQCGDQPAGQLAGGGVKGRNHRVDHRAVGQHIARRHAVFSLRDLPDAQGFAAAEVGHLTAGIDHRNLTILTEAILRQGQPQRLLR